MKKAAVLLAAVAVLAFAGHAWGVGEVYWINTGTGDFHNPNNWDAGRVPEADPEGNFDKPTIINGGTCQLQDLAPQVGTSYTFFQVGGSDDGGCLQIMDGAELHTGRLFIGRNGSVFQTGGTLVYIGNSEVKIGYDGVGGLFEISGGSIPNGGHITLAASGAKFKVDNSTGSPSQIKLKALNQNDGTLEIVLDSSGNTVLIDCWYSADLQGTLVIDDSNYTNPVVGHQAHLISTDDYRLDGHLTYDNLTFNDPNWKLVYVPHDESHPNTGDLYIEYVPEPATLVLLGLGGCLVLLRRKK